jgi:hypothetical protein
VILSQYIRSVWNFGREGANLAVILGPKKLGLDGSFAAGLAFGEARKIITGNARR